MVISHDTNGHVFSRRSSVCSDTLLMRKVEKSEEQVSAVADEPAGRTVL